MVEYFLKPGDLIITDYRYGILAKKTARYWYCHVLVHSAAESVNIKSIPWCIEKIEIKSLYKHLDEGRQNARIIYAPHPRRRRRASSSVVRATGS